MTMPLARRKIPIPQPEGGIAPLMDGLERVQNRQSNDGLVPAEHVDRGERASPRLALANRFVSRRAVHERDNLVTPTRPEHLELERRIVISEAVARLDERGEIRHVDARRQLVSPVGELD